MERQLHTDARASFVRVPCNLCGAENRVPRARVDEPVRCGRCKSVLLSGVVAAIGLERFFRVLRTCDLVVVVHVTSERVPSERRRDAVFTALARDLRAAALVFRIDADREPRALEALGLSAVPSIAVAMNGRIVSHVSGGLDRRALDTWIAAQALEALHSLGGVSNVVHAM